MEFTGVALQPLRKLTRLLLGKLAPLAYLPNLHDVP